MGEDVFIIGSGTMLPVFAEAGMEHSRKYRRPFEQFAKVSVKNQHHSTMNPGAMYQIETPLETVKRASGRSRARGSASRA